MRILILCDNFPPERNAAASRIFERARYWIRWGHQVTVVTSAPNFPEGKVYEGHENRWHNVEDYEGIRVVRVKTFIAPNKGFALRIADFVSYMLTGAIAGALESRPDVVLASSPQFFAGIAGAMVAKAQRRPFVLEVADLWPASITAVGAMKPGRVIRAAEVAELQLYAASSRVILLTLSFQDDLVRRGVPIAKTRVVINGADLERYAPMPRDVALAERLGLRDKFVVGYIGTLGMAHALENVLSAAERLRSEPEVRVLFVGPGAAREGLVREAARRGLENVVFVAAVPKEEVARYWSLCDVALVHLKDDPVFKQVIPSKIFEAMAMGLPVLVAAPAGEASRIVESERIGRVVPAEQPGELAQAISEMARDRVFVLAAAARSAEAVSRYTRESQARKVLEVLGDACGVSVE
jgi:glycosyltransferase involved in cell wall biosynthesis